MSAILIISLFSCFFAAYNAKGFSKCQMAHQLKAHGMKGYYGYSLADWVCMAEYASNLNTLASYGVYSDGSRDYGIFQLNNQRWCQDNNYPSKNGCNIKCSDLVDDDISDDINCVKKIVSESNGMPAWMPWEKNCKNKDLSKYLAKCPP